MFQVLEEYAKYGDAAIGKWFVRDSGQKNPNVRTVFKPLLNMFHGARGCKHWKQMIDAKFKTATSVSQMLEVISSCRCVVALVSCFLVKVSTVHASLMMCADMHVNM